VSQQIITDIDGRHITEEGERIYHEKLKPLLEPQYKGKIVAIEVDSGDYFLGDRVIEAVQKAKAKYPEKIFHVIRVGFRAVHKRR
jgi:hypothetical protein